jgi:[ribosomal protein S5]-alanine N-acetyltransferase
MLPTLRTSRLILSPFALGDAAAVQKMAGDHDVYRTTLNIPHPYPDGAAEKWIARHLTEFLENRHLTLAVRKSDQTLIGAIGLALSPEHRHAEMGYWIGRPFWNNGYCTEAAREILVHGFARMELNRIYARHLAINPASGRVMQKIGMTHEGHLRQHCFKEGKLLDVVIYGILREEFERIHSARSTPLC